MNKRVYLLPIAFGGTFCISFMDYGNTIIGLSGIFGMFLLPIVTLAIFFHFIEIISKKKPANWTLILLPLALFIGFISGEYAIAKQDINNQMKFYELPNEIEQFKTEEGRLPNKLHELNKEKIITQRLGFSTKTFDYWKEDSLHYRIGYCDNNGNEISFSSRTGELNSTPFSL